MPASNLWKGGGSELARLTGGKADLREFLLLSFAQAGRLCPPIEASLKRGIPKGSDGCHGGGGFPDPLRRRVGTGGLRRAAAGVVDAARAPAASPPAPSPGRRRCRAAAACRWTSWSSSTGGGPRRPDAVAAGAEGAGPAQGAAGAGARPVGAGGRRGDPGGARLLEDDGANRPPSARWCGWPWARRRRPAPVERRRRRPAGSATCWPS